MDDKTAASLGKFIAIIFILPMFHSCINNIEQGSSNNGVNYNQTIPDYQGYHDRQHNSW